MKQFQVFYPTYSPDKYDPKAFRAEMVSRGTITAESAKEALAIATRKFGGAPLVERIV